ncbi:ribosomal protein S18 acetylase RimI-like enzyme [Bacillus oleivorans]|uniref:Ribosomal protein S18 acetylase RimI-like enzyme n=1 Tax=Bacillus oleivorans TaxID=1448271 RepID=A0A285D270_9BACI|nr:GNAT family N-acetyltransferase [Bacillus oleivorans]SNX73917.1 ribosomal protein S18 acetylase RimI-like enzyme [Bacillus oleivorans]
MAYRKELFVWNGSENKKAVIRTYEKKDFEGLIDVQREAFPPPFPSELWWDHDQLHNHIHLFPDGALCVEIDGIIVGSMTGLLTDFDPNEPDHTWSEATDNGYIANHNPNGKTLYVVDICVRPSYRKFGLGKWLMHAMYETVIQLNLERLLGGGRLPYFHRYADALTIEEYVEKVVAGEVFDPVISFLLRCGRMPIHIVKNYLEDEESHNYGLLMEWKNPFYSDQR